MSNVDQILRNNNIAPPSAGETEYYTYCPQCRNIRKKEHKDQKKLGVKIDTQGVCWYCNHCGWSGGGSGRDRFIATHDYLNTNGTLLWQKVRYPPGHDPKCRIRRPDGNGGWIWGKGENQPSVMYRLPELNAAIAAGKEIVVVEGEKDADNLRRIGLPATCSPDGAAKPGQTPKWKTEHSKQLRGADIIVMGDHDEQGYAHQEATAQMSVGIAKRVRVLKLAEHWPDIKENGDVSDWLKAKHTREELLVLIAKAADYVLPEDFIPGTPDDGGHHARYTFVWAKDVIIRSKDWLWEGHLLRGAQELTTGLPDVGKSQLQCHYAGIITTTGRKWPDGSPGPTEAANVIMVTAEDTLDQEIVPRLIAAGADLSKVAFLKKIKKDKKERMFLLSEDIEVLGQMIADIRNVGMVGIDPITAFMGKINSNLPTDVRGQLGPLADLAERTNAMFSTITHPPKAGGQRAIDHFISSQAFIAAARIGHLCIEEIEIGEDGKPVRDEKGHAKTTGRNLLAVVRCAAGPKMPTLAYRIAVLTVGQDPLKRKSIIAPYVVFDEQSLNVTADQAVSNVHAAREREKKQTGGNAVSFVEDMLANGPVPIKMIEARAAGRFSKDQLNRAKTKLGIEPYKDGAGGWIWALPDPKLDL